MRVLFATSEATPFIKSGGLADVLGSLPKEMVKKGVESIVVLPKYQDMKLADKIEFVTNFDIWVGWRKVYCGVFTYVVDGVYVSILLIMNSTIVVQDCMVMMMIMKDLHTLILQFLN
ncbi:glycogen/starch synthase [Thomasclavelia cocleata]|uniref:glycogen/starch synthase n=1 Tax=Thomasclavelia cocleata TaxID=69824 RepID=UPI002576F931|nr:glycogen/starch synthase [Thomasclavelia cocleata]